MQAEAGKGSAPRKNQDQDQDEYRQNWEESFGKKKRYKVLEELVRLSEELGLYDEKPESDKKR